MSDGFQTTVAFPNGLMWPMSEDDKQLEIPDIDGVANFWASHNAWGIAVQHDADGEVRVSISGSPPDDPSLAPLQKGVLHSGRQLDGDIAQRQGSGSGRPITPRAGLPVRRGT